MENHLKKQGEIKHSQNKAARLNRNTLQKKRKESDEGEAMGKRRPHASIAKPLKKKEGNEWKQIQEQVLQNENHAKKKGKLNAAKTGIQNMLKWNTEKNRTYIENTS